MSYDFAYYLGEYLDAGVIMLNLISNSIGSLVSIGMYVLTALGLYTIAKRRAISKAWLAWIPVVNCWLVGCISDQYRYVVKGQVKSRRKSLLVLSIIQMVLGTAVAVTAVVAGIGIVSRLMMDYGYGYGYDMYDLLPELMTPVIVLLALCLPLAGVAIARTVVYYMAMYDLYSSCSPENNVLFLVLSIFFRITEPFFVFFNRNNDKGMPPRKVEYQDV